MHLIFQKILIFTIFNYVLGGENLLLKTGNRKRSLNYAGEFNEAGIPIKTSNIYKITSKDTSSLPENNVDLFNSKLMSKKNYLHCKYYPNYVKCLEKSVIPDSNINSVIPDVSTNSKPLLKKHLTHKMPATNLHKKHSTISLVQNILRQILPQISRKKAALSKKKLFTKPAATFKSTVKPQTTNEKIEIYQKLPVVIGLDFPEIKQFTSFPSFPEFPQFSSVDMPKNTEFPVFTEIEMPKFPTFPELGIPSMPKFSEFPEKDFPNIPDLFHFPEVDKPDIPEFPATVSLITFPTDTMDIGFPEVSEISKSIFQNIKQPQVKEDDKFIKDVFNEFVQNQNLFEGHKYSLQNGLNGLRKIKIYRNQFSTKNDDKVDGGGKSFVETFLYKGNPNNATEFDKLFNVNSFTSVENN